MKKILVTGGAGYVGSHVCKRLAQAGHDLLIVDNLTTGNKWALKWGRHAAIDLLDKGAVLNVIAGFQPDVIMHFAAASLVGESIEQPLKYFQTNLVSALNLLQAHVPIIFSSTCAIFGVPQRPSIDEHHPKNPINPYGQSKLMVEQILQECWRAHQIPSVSLRYFNASGCDPEGEIGEAHDPETHLIPRVIEAAIKETPVAIFGTDYPTPDGTAIRDYIHVDDLATAHILALDHVDGCHACNIGTGRGYSVEEVICAVEKVSGKPIARDIVARREGDPPILVANPQKAFTEWGFQPRYTELEPIIETAWQWHRKRS